MSVLLYASNKRFLPGPSDSVTMTLSPASPVSMLKPFFYSADAAGLYPDDPLPLEHSNNLCILTPATTTSSQKIIVVLLELVNFNGGDAYQACLFKGLVVLVPVALVEESTDEERLGYTIPPPSKAPEIQL